MDPSAAPNPPQRLGEFLGRLTVAAPLPAVAPALPALFDDTFSVLKLVLTLAILALSLALHEAAHAWAALKCGDSTARDLGRLTLNPIPHIDLWWTILIPGMILLFSNGAFVFGGAKPVPVDFHRLRNPWRDMSLVAAAGPLSNLVLVFVFVFLWHFFVKTGLYNGAAEDPYLRQGDLLPVVMLQGAFLNALLFAFNLIPIPPLDGSRILTWLLPSSLRESYNAVGGFGILIVFLLMRWQPFARQVYGAMDTALGVAEQAVTLGGRW
ncbi:MAG: site-2 protease family protein [Planctomycetes bacterium]|nr:site-2 protease family protein [Planctomycetota bacterium]